MIGPSSEAAVRLMTQNGFQKFARIRAFVRGILLCSLRNSRAARQFSDLVNQRVLTAAMDRSPGASALKVANVRGSISVSCVWCSFGRV